MRLVRNRVSGHGEEGSLSVQVFVLLLFLSVLLAGGSVIHAFAGGRMRVMRDRGELKELLLQETGSVITLIASDPTPESDSRIDPVWKAIEAGMVNGVDLELEDVSSAINLNWAGKNLFEKTSLSDLFLPGKDRAQLQQYRETTGLHADREAGYGSFFAPDTLKKYFTTFGYANINTTDEFALRKLALLRSGSSAVSEMFHRKVQDALTAKKIITEADLPEFLGSSFGLLFPIVNTEPVFNVHFLEPFLLRAVIGYPDYGIEDPDRKTEMILASVRAAELRSEDIRSVLGKEGPQRVYEYLGTITWFWKITVRKGGASLVTVLARIPDDPGAPASKPRFIITGRRFTP